jgi:capsular polysaccharide export protein
MYAESYKLLVDAQRRKIDLGDMHARKVYFGCRMIKEAFQTFTDLSLKRTVATYYPDKYFSTDVTANARNSIVGLSIFGPGDEIRFASIYDLIPQQLPHSDITVSCEPRLLPLLSRSFSNLKFVPVRRPRDSEPIELNNYTKVLGSDLIRVIDDTATEAIDSADHVVLVTDMLHECLPNYQAFPGKPYLKHNDVLSKQYREALPNGAKKLVGLSWRSSLTTHSRNEHYLSVEELEPIFKIEGVQFVNFQYDECEAELEWIEKRYPGKVLNISGIDHYNDFESVAALMKCMDLMIAPATTVVELAGALGCPTWLLSNSSELHWRKTDQRGTDVWHNSITHVEGDVLGDKSTLVEQLCVKLAAFAGNQPSRISAQNPSSQSSEVQCA